jgi:hypothetical protein
MDEPYAYLIRRSFPFEAVRWSLKMLGTISITLRSLAFLLCRKAGLSSTRPYRVLMKGEPLWLMLVDQVEEIGGFYTTRWVLASSPEEAVAHAVRIVRQDLEREARNPPESPVRIEIEEVAELGGYVTWQGGGFTFWPKDEAQFDRMGSSVS